MAQMIAVHVKRVLVRRPLRRRRGVAPGLALTADARELLEDPEIDIVVEVMGGEHPALEYIQAAIQAGKHVVTANKEVMAKHGPEVLSLAERHGTSVRFEGSVGGGIPIIGPLLKDLLANDITAVRAIINGTTNYVLTRMAQDGIDFHSMAMVPEPHMGSSRAAFRSHPDSSKIPAAIDSLSGLFTWMGR